MIYNKKTSSVFQKGFTIIELLVVIAIIGLLSSIIITNTSVSKMKARDTTRKQNLNQLEKAINLYYSQNGTLPPTAAHGGGTNWCTYLSNATGGANVNFAADMKPYIPSIPHDPSTLTGPGDYVFWNQNDSTGKYKLCAIVEQSSMANDSFNATAQGCAGSPGTYNYCVNQ